MCGCSNISSPREVFRAEGLDGASLRAIAAGAGYTPAALHFHSEFKEAVHAEMLQASLARLAEAVDQAVAEVVDPANRLRRASMAFFGFYAEHSDDFNLGSYLFRGGMRLLLAHTGRIRMFGAAAPSLLEAYVEDCIARLAYR